jgi:predicted nucleotidyltransferase
MIDKVYVDKWLTEFVAKLRQAFGERLVWVGHHGSWARGEARSESDIDMMVILDKVEANDLVTFREIVSSMPDARSLASGLLLSISELKRTPRFYTVEYFHGRKELYGSIDGIIEHPRAEDLVSDIELKVSDNLLAARHYFLFPHDLTKVVLKLKYPFKNCFYALESWVMLTQDKFISTKNDILELLDDPVDKQVIIVARDWYKLTDDLIERPAYYIELLERWGRGMIGKLEACSRKK